MLHRIRAPSSGILTNNTFAFERFLLLYRLPHLIASRALCPLDYIFIEWHINFVQPVDRLAALGLRLAFDDLISHGCPPQERPRVIEHDELQNARNFRVPGLSERARFHNGLEGAIKASMLPEGFKLIGEGEDRTVVSIHRDASSPVK